MEPPFDPPNPLLCLYRKDSKSAYNTDTATPVLIAAQFIIAGTILVPHCPDLQ